MYIDCNLIRATGPNSYVFDIQLVIKSILTKVNINNKLIINKLYILVRLPFNLINSLLREADIFNPQLQRCNATVHVFFDAVTHIKRNTFANSRIIIGHPKGNGINGVAVFLF